MRREKQNRVPIYIKFKNRQNRSLALEVRTVATPGGAVTVTGHRAWGAGTVLSASGH